jgi:phytoene synthase
MQDAFAHCEALVRAANKDRFLATLFAPAAHRGALCALYAFNSEIARVRELVREPLAGEIRLQWWRDALSGAPHGDAEANPVAAALLATVARYRLPPSLLLDLIEAHRFDLYDEPMATLAEFEAYAGHTAATLIELAAQILNAGEDPDIRPLARHAGLAHAIAGLLRALPVHAARGQLYLPLDLLQRRGASRADIAARRATPELEAALAELRMLARAELAAARDLLPTAPRQVMPALLPVALVLPLLDRMERGGQDPFVPVELPQWRRQWWLWRAARRDLARAL